MKKSRLAHRYEKEKIDRFKQVSRIAMGYYSLPLYFAFWIADLIYVPQFKWQFLALRSLIIPSSFLCNWLVQRAKSLNAVEKACSLISVVNAFPIVGMIWAIGDIKSPYYAGLLMVAAGMGNFFPWTMPYFALQMGLIFAPYYFLVVLKASPDDLGLMLVHSFFVLGILVIASVIRLFSERLFVREFQQRITIEREAKNRDRVIRAKTVEALRLERLSRQFSPQVVSMIKAGVLDIDRPPKLANICALVVDISGYSRACRHLPPKQIQEVLSRFYKLSMQRLFKYDITFDKTVGDAVVGFCNEPVQYRDYVQRVTQAVIEIHEDVERQKSDFSQLWGGPLEIHSGIAVGEAEVGFFGDDSSPKNFTASGEVMNLASRLSDSARPGEILVTSDVQSYLAKNSEAKWDVFEFESLGKRPLEGYEDSPRTLYSVSAVSQTFFSSVDCPTCPHGHGQLHLNENNQGLFVFRCRVCEYEAGTALDAKKAA